MPPSVLMALLQQHCFKKQTNGMGEQVFLVSVQRFPLAVGHLHFCNERLMLPLLGNIDWNHKQYRRRSLLRDRSALEPPACASGAVALPPWAAAIAGFFNDTQASRVF